MPRECVSNKRLNRRDWSCNAGQNLEHSKTSLWSALIANNKVLSIVHWQGMVVLTNRQIRREEDSGNLVRVEGFCTLTILRTTLDVPIAASDL
jgi:hypothetical protein